MTQSLLPPPALGFEVIRSRFTNGGIRPVAAVAIPVVEQIARGNCDLNIREDFCVSSCQTMAVPLPRSSPLTRPSTLPPEFVPPCRVPPLCYQCNYFWSSTQSATKLMSCVNQHFSFLHCSQPLLSIFLGHIWLEMG